MVNAPGSQGECAVVIGHLRARHVAGKTAFLDARSAQHGGWQALAFSDETHNSCPTIGLNITRFVAMTYGRRPGPLLDTWTGFLDAFRRPDRRPNMFEHTSLAPSRKAVSGRGAPRPAFIAGRASSARRPGALWGRYSAQRATRVLRAYGATEEQLPECRVASPSPRPSRRAERKIILRPIPSRVEAGGPAPSLDRPEGAAKRWRRGHFPPFRARTPTA